ncbi:ribosomal protein S18-alanine N-acetyltransferase [secondary endosymbiont of Ctenarytaina eucalypti]|uniref:[Ribosomal protein bS18]-alanine N-acetyltransferase n=1 Tax=secondary endosymbiont of Ctenarytaina eucalypti TaxID=1199245 RepID=J3VS86_9ENTR|nr:ribosomal protein S18-alanine N-acetyltransferase [secondary endosymbiont of Ctenarytaina eucalypti]AFP84841.1 ribosomal-protein-alanine acetyltransferase [secondary endosymbiont of Ctenarytaina eucalypti]
MNTIVPLLPDDMSEAWNIEQLSHELPWSEKTFSENQGRNYLNFKRCVGDRIVAFAITQTVLDEASLFNIAVHPHYQRLGHGSALLDHLITELTQRKVLTLWLEVRESNATALALYHSRGFNEVSIRHHYYPLTEGRMNALIIALPLG